MSHEVAHSVPHRQSHTTSHKTLEVKNLFLVTQVSTELRFTYKHLKFSRMQILGKTREVFSSFTILFFEWPILCFHVW